MKKLDPETKALIEMIDRRIAELRRLRAEFRATLKRSKEGN